MVSECLNLTELSVCVLHPHMKQDKGVLSDVILSRCYCCCLNWLTLHGYASYLLCIFIFEVKRDVQICCHGILRFPRLRNHLLYMGVMSRTLTGLHPSPNSLSEETIVIMKCTRCTLISCRGSNKCIKKT